MKHYYTYLWLREDGTPYYAGKGSGMRAFKSVGHLVTCPSSKDRIIVQYFNNEQDALQAEIFLIDFYGRIDLGTGCLRNLASGGYGGGAMLGRKHSETTKQRQRAVAIGRKHSPETIAKMLGNSNSAGRVLSPESRMKLSRSLQGKKFSPERIKNLSLSHIGLPSSWTGKKHKPESRELMSIKAKMRLERAMQILEFSTEKEFINYLKSLDPKFTRFKYTYFNDSHYPMRLQFKPLTDLAEFVQV